MAAAGGTALDPFAFTLMLDALRPGTYATRRIYDPSDGICRCRSSYRRVASLLARYVRLGRSRVVGNVDDDPIHQPNGVSRYASLHAKLDELLRTHGDARTELAALDESDVEDIEDIVASSASETRRRTAKSPAALASQRCGSPA